MSYSVSQERKIVTELPGPRSVELQKRREKSVSRGAGTLANIYMDHGAGAILVDVDGNQLIDLGCGIGVTTIGHAHPEVAAAAAAQAAKLTHTLFTVTPYENYVRVAEKLAEITPGDFEKHSILVNSGAEAVENAVKIARKFTGRRAIVALDHAFHGRTNLTMTMTYRPWPERAGMGPFPGEIYSVPTSYPYRDGLSGAEAAAKTIDYITTHIGASEIAAFFVEPIQGDGGIVIPAPGYFAAIKSFCEENGILFVADEIQAGIARTGAWYSIEHHGVVPDLITTAKGIAGGFPLAAVTGRAEVMDSVQPGGIGGTFGGNPVSTAAALAVFEIIERDGLLAEAQRVERQLRARIGDWTERYDVVGEVRGKGAMFGVELVKPGTTDPNPEALSSVLRYATTHGVIPLDAGSWDSVLRIMPSVVISEELIDDAASVLEAALARL
ncbi:aminotransferase class III-fold pyridoxal phosphate-dependent enzyme [Galbitalea soli]|uniref:(S)-3-amino-2-methylpropionate transaminase n=1 Tax=Galbitalea soli TaxID=1268042 RepID=A0A7C9TQ71_9MICO|nr:aminotransferase class III-fold pyridoxal phosphate-dependent enzyme [Galbitalea soli]NEM90424.1 aminotransferase class III-fold pyridoxal phosphate-dependent enzyme [Galbitalea soli]NYJ31135.1 4-aminobutyrate aminotransferase/(S)-3-amino-2-methylpropionate transaminase [Galbitalea soli]